MIKPLKRFASPFVLILLLCLSFQMLYAYLDRAPDTDEAFYMQVARNINRTGLPFESVQDEILFLQHPSTFCYLVAFFFFLLGEGLFVGRLVSTIFSLAILFLVYRIARKYKDEKTALFVTFILAINPAFLYYSHSVYMEITQAFFSLLSIYLFLEAEENGELKYLWSSGLFLGLALITKYSSLVLFVFFIFCFLSQYRSKFLLRREVHVFLLPIIGCLAVWFIFGYAIGGGEFFHQLSRWLKISERSPYSWRNVTKFVYLKELIGVVTLGFLLIFVYSIYNWLKTKGKKFKPGLLTLLPIYFLFYVFYIFSMPIKDIKYVVPLLPISAIFISLHIEFDFKWRSDLKGIGTAFLLFLLVFNLSPLSVMYDPTTGEFH
jgi:4-amino-4-deoxy-L-arabinose transferase-like glycosyltransferase